jgi:hypothetical protein
MSEKETLFETEFINKSSGNYSIRDQGVAVLAVVPAGEKFTLTSCSPKTLWARFKEVTIEKDRKMSFRVNKAWSMPWLHEWVVELVNDTDIVHSTAFLPPNPLASGAGFVHVPPYMTLLVPVSSEDPKCQFSKVHWHWAEVKRPVKGAPGFFTKDYEVVTDRIKRPVAELEEIARRWREAAVKKANKEAEAHLAVKVKELLGEAPAAPKESQDAL